MKKVLTVLLMLSVILSNLSFVKAENSLFVVENDSIDFEAGTRERIGVKFYGSEDQIDYIKINGHDTQIGGHVLFTNNPDHLLIQARTDITEYNTVYVENQNEMIIGYHVDSESYEFQFNFNITHCDYAPTASITATEWRPDDGDIVITSTGVLENAYIYISKNNYYDALKYDETVDQEKIQVEYDLGTITLFSSYLRTLEPGIYYVTVGWNGCFHNFCIYIKSSENDPDVTISTNIWYSTESDIRIQTDHSLEEYSFNIYMYGSSQQVFDYYSMDDKTQINYENNEIIILSSFLKTLDEGEYYICFEQLGCFYEFSVTILKEKKYYSVISDSINLAGKSGEEVRFILYIDLSSITGRYINDISVGDDYFFMYGDRNYCQMQFGNDRSAYVEGLNILRIEFIENNETKSIEIPFNVENVDFDPEVTISDTIWYPGHGDIIIQTDGPLETMGLRINPRSTKETVILLGDVCDLVNQELGIDWNIEKGMLIISEEYLESLEIGEYIIYVSWIGQAVKRFNFSVLEEKTDYIVINDTVDFSKSRWGDFNTSNIIVRVFVEVSNITINGQEHLYYFSSNNTIRIYPNTINHDAYNEGENTLEIFYTEEETEKSISIPVFFHNIDFDPKCEISSLYWGAGQEDLVVSMDYPVLESSFRIHCIKDNEHIVYSYDSKENNNCEGIVGFDENNNKLIIYNDYLFNELSGYSITFEVDWVEKHYVYNLVEIVDSIEVETVFLNKETLNLLKGRSEVLQATILPENATDKSVIWTSSDESVAIVDDNGVVTGISEGTATITVTTSNGISASCEVSVAEETTSPVIIQSSSLVLEGVIQIQFKTTVPDPENTKIVVHFEGETDKNSYEKTYLATEGIRRVESGKEVYYYRVPVYAKQMNDKVTIWFTDLEGNRVSFYRASGADVTESGFEYSVATYIDNKWDSGTEKTRELVRAMKYYGLYAQKEFKYEVALADEILSTLEPIREVDISLLEMYAAEKEGEAPEGLSLGSYSLTLTDDVRINYKLKVGSDIDFSEYSIRLDGVTVEAEKSGSDWYVYKRNIVAKDLDTMHELVISDGSKTMTYRYGILTYCYNKLNSDSTSESIKNLCKAIYWYSVAADKYWGN